MAPDRGSPPSGLIPGDNEDGDLQISSSSSSPRHNRPAYPLRQRHPHRSTARSYFAEHASEPQSFTIRGVLVGLVIGVVICFSNMYFGLQTGWVSGMAMPSALIGFAYFKTVARYIDYPFTPVENVLVQSVAGSVGTMPLGCGFVGVIPALNYLLKPEENGPLEISLWKLIVWAVGICFFGVVFAVPLRREVIIREKLKFPSGTATALMIRVLHGDQKSINQALEGSGDEPDSPVQEQQALLGPPLSDNMEADHNLVSSTTEQIDEGVRLGQQGDWKAKIQLLFISFAVSAGYTLVSYFIPQLHGIPILGLPLARNWLWKLNPSPAYVGQGIIMGPATTLHMFLGAIVGWGVLSPLAQKKKWAPGPVGDWSSGSKGWIVWISLAIMLADSLVSLGWLVLWLLISYARIYLPKLREILREHTWKEILTLNIRFRKGYSLLSDGSSPNSTDPVTASVTASKHHLSSDAAPDAAPAHLISNRTTVIGLVLSLGLCIIAVHVSFPSLIPVQLTILALVLALLLSIMGVRALGETDLNPVSGISKLTQLLFALVTPTTGPAARNSVIINLLAGAISESAALQAGDLMQDLKTGHLLGAAPNAQFWGQIIGSAVGAVISAGVYKLYTRVYEIPGGMFQVPTGYVWVFTARLVTGNGLPPMVAEWATGAAVVFAIGTAVRVWGNIRKQKGLAGWWVDWIPGGIAVAVGMYNVPSFTLARTIGGVLNWWWTRYKGKLETPIIVLASGLILGEGLFSIVNLLLASLNVPHL